MTNEDPRQVQSLSSNFLLLQATQWVLRTANDTNVGARVLALENLVVWKALQANLLQAEPANETAVVGMASALQQFNPYWHFLEKVQLLESFCMASGTSALTIS